MEIGTGAGTGTRPYEINGIGGQCNDTVDVVGHDDKGIDVNAGIMGRDFVPYGLHHSACVVQAHFAIQYLTKGVNTVLGDDGDEIQTGLGVIVSMQAKRPAKVAFRIVGHGHAPKISPSNPSVSASSARMSARISSRVRSGCGL